MFLVMLCCSILTYCNREEIDLIIFIYENQTSHHIKIETYGENGLVSIVNIASNSNYSLEPYRLPSFGEAMENPFIFRNSNLFARIVFDESKALVYINERENCSDRDPWCYFSNTSYKVTSSNLVRKWELHSVLTYAFTEEDYNNATPLVFGEGFVGSVWRCTEGAGLQEGLLYNELRFVSENQVEGWVHLEGEEEPKLNFTATYFLEGETLTISEDGDDSFTATLNEAYTGLRTNIDGEGECVFYKQ